MSEVHSPLPHVIWKDLFPWLIILRSFRLALRLPVLFCAFAAIILLPLGWRCAAFLFVERDVLSNDPHLANLVAGHSNWLLAGQLGYPSLSWPPSSQGVWDSLTVFSQVFVEIAAPFVELFRADASVSKSAYLLSGGLWSLIVWGWFAAVITRFVGVELATDESRGISRAIRHATKCFMTYLTAPLYPMAGVFLVTFPLVLLGLAMRTDFGVLIGGLISPLVVLMGIILAILLLGLLCGWPLMWPIVSLEVQGDSFEALSRSYSFALQKPLHYLFYLVVASGVGGLGVLFVNTFVDAVTALSFWGLSWGTGVSRIAELTSLTTTRDSTTLSGGVWLIEFWIGILRIAGHAFRYSFFWCAMAAIYLLLRRDVDNTEFDDIYLEEVEKPSIANEIDSPAENSEDGAKVSVNSKSE